MRKFIQCVAVLVVASVIALAIAVKMMDENTPSVSEGVDPTIFGAMMIPMTIAALIMTSIIKRK